MALGEPSSRQQIRDIILVLTSGVAVAVILAAVMVYNYGPSGVYSIKEALIEPGLVTTLDYNDYNSVTNGTDRYVYNGIDFSYFDPNNRSAQRSIPVSHEAYQQFYRLIESDNSIKDTPRDIVNLFNPNLSATLSINVRPESHADKQNNNKQFQSINFAMQGDYYRIKLHEEKSPNEWVYFHHPGIYQQVLHIFTAKS